MISSPNFPLHPLLGLDIRPSTLNLSTLSYTETPLTDMPLVEPRLIQPQLFGTKSHSHDENAMKLVKQPHLVPFSRMLAT